MDPEDEIRILREAIRLLAGQVGARLWERGWMVTDLNVPDGEPLEWFWPPTAPIGYGGASPAAPLRPGMMREHKTPWLIPTRLTLDAGRWVLQYGQTRHQKADAAKSYADHDTLLADLQRIEWWPMSVMEARETQAWRVLEVTTAAAWDQHYRGAHCTEPYAGRIDALRAHLRFEENRALGMDADPPATPRPPGDLGAQLRLLDAEAWASAVRTARAGGEGFELT